MQHVTEIQDLPQDLLEEAEREQNRQPCYDTNLPGFIMDDDQLSPKSIILYGVIRSLATRKGYCWASNEYLAKIIKCEQRNVQYCLAKLIARGHIVTEFFTHKGFHNYRKLWISESFQKSLTHAKNCRGPCKELHDSPYTDIKINIKKINKKEKIPVPAAPEKKAYRDFVNLTESQYEELLKIYGSDEMRQKALDILNNGKASKGYKYKNDFFVMKENEWVWVRVFEKKESKFSKVSGGDSEVNRKIAEEAQKIWKSQHYIIEVLSKAVEIIPKGPGTAIVINYTELGFKDQLESALNKKNFTKALPKNPKENI